MALNFTGKSAVVTGGANGIGLAVAQAMAKGGAQVWIFDLEGEDPRAVAAGFGARACVADVTDRASLDAAFTQTGPPDILVANAGADRFSFRPNRIHEEVVVHRRALRVLGYSRPESVDGPPDTLNCYRLPGRAGSSADARAEPPYIVPIWSTKPPATSTLPSGSSVAV